MLTMCYGFDFFQYCRFPILFTIQNLIFIEHDYSHTRTINNILKLIMPAVTLVSSGKQQMCFINKCDINFSFGREFINELSRFVDSVTSQAKTLCNLLIYSNLLGMINQNMTINFAPEQLFAICQNLVENGRIQNCLSSTGFALNKNQLTILSTFYSIIYLGNDRLFCINLLIS